MLSGPDKLRRDPPQHSHRTTRKFSFGMHYIDVQCACYVHLDINIPCL